jgi:TRAP-type C4-dicarboxylate transport system permease small subunit
MDDWEGRAPRGDRPSSSRWFRGGGTVRGAGVARGFALRSASSVSDSVYKRIDHAVHRAERAVVVGSLLVMSVVVFLDVVHRSFSSDESKLAAALARMAGWVGVELPADSSGYAQLAAVSPYVLFAMFAGLAYFGIRSTRRATPIAAPIAAAVAVAGVLVAYGLVRLLLVLVPNGLIWSQDLALVLTLWVGFVGASMCTYENRHLKVEAAQKLLPAKVRPVIGFVSGLFTALVCAGLLWVSLRYVAFHRLEYIGTEGQGGLFPGMSLPKWVGFLALPLSFGFMTVRFFVKALGALRGEVEPPLDPLAAVTGGSAGAGARGLEAGRMPSEVATEALPMARVDEESSIDTMTSKARMQVREPAAPRPQSKVPTDAHDVLPSLRGGLDDLDAVDPALTSTRELDEGPLGLLDDTRELEDGLPGGKVRR